MKTAIKIIAWLLGTILFAIFLIDKLKAWTWCENHIKLVRVNAGGVLLNLLLALVLVALSLLIACKRIDKSKKELQ